MIATVGNFDDIRFSPMSGNGTCGEEALFAHLQCSLVLTYERTFVVAIQAIYVPNRFDQLARAGRGRIEVSFAP